MRGNCSCTNLRLIGHRKSHGAFEEIAISHLHKRSVIIDAHFAPRQNRPFFRPRAPTLRKRFRCTMMNERLNQFEHRAIIAKCFVRFECCEFWIVTSVDSLVAKISVDLEDLWKSADKQSLQIQLGRNSHKERHSKSIMRCHERSRRSAASHRMHHRSLDFEEASAFHEMSDRADNVRTSLKCFDGLRICEHIHIPPAISQFRIFQAMPLRWRRFEILRLNRQLLCPNTNLAFLRLSDPALGGNNVAIIQCFGDLEVNGGHRRLGNADLQIAGSIAQTDKNDFAHIAVLNNSASNNDHCAVVRNDCIWIFF